MTSTVQVFHEMVSYVLSSSISGTIKIGVLVNKIHGTWFLEQLYEACARKHSSRETGAGTKQD